MTELEEVAAAILRAIKQARAEVPASVREAVEVVRRVMPGEDRGPILYGVADALYFQASRGSSTTWCTTLAR